MLSVADAVAAVLGRVPRLGSERVPLDAALGRVLADDIVATRALPGFDNSAMDGYAARSDELPATLPIAGAVHAGEVWQTAVPAGSAIRIMTGAPMPAGLDTVVIQEDATVVGGRVTLPASPAGDNLRVVGEDIAIGETAIRAGTRLGGWEIGLLAALGVSAVSVTKQPRVALIATGDELVDVATVPGHGQLVDSSVHSLAGLVRAAGGDAHRIGIARDDVGALRAAITSALGHDAVITTGGVSVGDRDFVRAALAEAGVTLELWKVAMKPGKPFSFGTGNHTAVFGLPGNPVSTVVGFELFVRPALLAMQGARTVERPRVPVRLAGGYAKQPGRIHFLRATVHREGERLVAVAHAKQGSAMMSSLVGCNALVEIAADATEVAPGASVPAILLEAV
jgi:molybdopterin molybdotransferase